jgi:hypothetical protein
MSKRIPFGVIRSILPVLVITIFLPAALHADPNATPGRNATPMKAEATVRTSFAPSSQVARPAARRPALLTREMPFREAVDILRHSTTPPLNIVVLWKEVEENAGIHPETPIGFDGVPGLRVGQSLDLLVLSLSAGASARLGYVVRNGTVIIGTADSLPAPPKVTRVYDVSDLVGEPARYFFPPFGFGGMGYGGYGGPMMGAGGYAGGFGGYGYGPGASYTSGGSYGLNNAGGLPGFIGRTYGNTAPIYRGR